jgi:hypothetical protein
MKSETFIRVAQLSELNGDGPFALSANEADIVLVKSKGNWRAFEGRCPHQGALLGEGMPTKHSLSETVDLSHSVAESLNVRASLSRQGSTSEGVPVAPLPNK